MGFTLVSKMSILGLTLQALLLHLLRRFYRLGIYNYRLVLTDTYNTNRQ